MTVRDEKMNRARRYFAKQRRLLNYIIIERDGRLAWLLYS